RGVLAERDIHSFRYYDEALFRTLDERTRTAYNEIAALPVVRDISDAKLRRSVVGSPTRVGKAGVQDLYVDITGILAINAIAPTGIARVDLFVARQAINDPDPSVRVIIYDRWKDAYRSPTNREISQLNSAVSTRKMVGSLNTRDLLRDAFQTIRGNPFYRWARSTELGDFIVKTVIRCYRIYRWALYRARRRRLSEPSKGDPMNGIVLMPHPMVFGSWFKENILATGHPAFICHDLIPWLHPEFVETQPQAQRFVSRLTLLVRSGVHALCTSDTSRAMLSQFVADVGNASARIDQFPLPSMLHETAKSLDRLLHFEPEQPFVLYCSTVEIRKNHLLLAKIWKQARDEGVALPKLVCAGKWGWGVESLHAYLRANPDLSECMEFVGFVSDIELIDLYRSALFGVMPSHIEGWGFGASECLDFGIPVIVSTAPALQEAVRGLMPAIDPSDQAGWYTQIQRWAESAAERETFRKKIADHYHPITRQESWEAIKTALRASGVN
ncbi:MAG: glycosyltransferase, partial [Candidatus Poribacteria bacterium]|nr:glycosyltransferase [Candidatus Poribacteria bacterium]